MNSSVELISTIVYFFVGIFFCIVGYKLFDKITPFDLDKEIDDHNMGAGLAVAGIFIAIAIIISGAIA